MASWEQHFRQGVNAFRTSEYEKALQRFDEAIEKGGERYNVYDSRAATFEKLGLIKQALKDSRKVIELVPDMRHGYVRSARLFLKLGKYSVASEMIDLGLERVPLKYPLLRVELEALQRTIIQEKEIARISTKTPCFSKLPVELISEVFLFAMEGDFAFPVLASLVSSHWRTIAISMPILWGHITLSSIAPAKKMSLWLKRSKNRITSLRIRNTISRLQLCDAIEVCGPGFVSSLKSVHCEVDVVQLTSRLLNIPNVHKLNLEDIHLSLPGRQVDILSPLGPLVPLDRMSTVRSLILDFVAVNWSIVTPRLSHLRILTIRTKNEHGVTAEHLSKLLSSNPHLEKFVLESWSAIDMRDFRTQSRIELPHLSHLELLGPMLAGVLVAQLFLPCLERLAIFRSHSTADQVMDALEPPSMSITELSFQGCFFFEERLASILRTMSKLTKLEITQTGSGIDVVVDAIAGTQEVAGETKLVCPMLTHVNFSHCPNLHGGPIVRLVKSRLTANAGALSASEQKSPPAKIELVYIDGCYNVDESVPEWLRTRVNKISCTYMTVKDVVWVRP